MFWGRKEKSEPARRVIFHFGPPKTATSTFHALLRNNASLFGPGIAVSARDNLTSRLRDLAAKMLENKGKVSRARLRETVQTMRHEMAAMPAETIIVSDENMFGVFSKTVFSARFEDGPEQVLSEIETALAGWDLQYICYTRDPQKWRDSCYGQTVKGSGGTEDYATWIALHPDLTVPQRMVDRFSSVLGDRLEVVPMEAEVVADGYVGRRVLELAGIDAAVIDAVTIPPPRNVAVSPASLEFIRQMNSLGLPSSERQKVVRLVEKTQGLFNAGEI